MAKRLLGDAELDRIGRAMRLRRGIATETDAASSSPSPTSAASPRPTRRTQR
jgi:hypothetical protein